MNTVIIAEAGVNHNGDINRAFQLIDVAVSAGADFVVISTILEQNPNWNILDIGCGGGLLSEPMTRLTDLS